EGARLFGPGNAAGVTRAVESVLDDPAWAERARAKNRRVIESRGDWSANMSRIESMFESLVRGYGPAGADRAGRRAPGGGAPAPGGRLRRPAVELSARQRPHGRARPPAPLWDSVGRRLPRPVGGASPPPPGHRLAPRRPGGPRAPGARGRGPGPRRLAHPRRFARRAPRPGVRGK